MDQLDSWATAGDFRVLYATQGEHAPKRMHDKNRNGTPDYVDDILTQLQAAQDVFENVWGLTSPLKQARHAGVVTSIDVAVLVMRGNTGVAYSSVRGYRAAAEGDKIRCSLRIDVSNELVPHTLTPVHELFHLYQYGYTQIKVRWFLEGMARWSESAIAKREPPATTLPSSPETLEAVMTSNYSAVSFWHRLGKLLDPNGLMSKSADFEKRRYTDGRFVFKDQIFEGGSLVKLTLEKLQALEAPLASRLGWTASAWQEKRKFSPLLNHDVMHSALAAFCDLADADTRRLPEVQALRRSAAALNISTDACD